MGRLQGAGDLGIRGSEQAGDLLGQRLIGGQPGELGLPEIEIAPGQLVEIACRSSFSEAMTHYSASMMARSPGDHAVRMRKPGVLLSHCGIGAKVAASEVNGCSLRGALRSEA